MEILYKNKKYYTQDIADNEKLFLFNDKDLSEVAKVNGQTLMVRVEDIQEKLQ